MASKEYILTELESGTKPLKNLFASLSKTKKITKQAFYKSIRDLVHEEKITIHNKQASLSIAWLIQQQDRITKIYEAYDIPLNQEFTLRAQKTIYTFKTLKELDVFLSHIFLLLLKRTKNPVYTYNEHEWYSYGREQTNETLVLYATKTGRPVNVTVASNTPLDRALAKSFNTKPFHYFMSSAKIFPNGVSYNVFDTYVLTIKLDTQINSDINTWFINNKSFNEQAREEMQSIIQRKGKHKVVLQNNTVLANTILKKLEKYFI